MPPQTEKPATERVSGLHSVEQLGGGLDLIQTRSTALRKPGTASTNAERQRHYRPRNPKRNDRDCHERNRNALTVTAPVTNGDVTLLCAQQDKIEFAFNDDGDAITQSRWPDEDQTIIVSRDNIGTFIDNLTDALGIGSAGRP